MGGGICYYILPESRMLYNDLSRFLITEGLFQRLYSRDMYRNTNSNQNQKYPDYQKVDEEDCRGKDCYPEEGNNIDFEF